MLDAAAGMGAIDHWHLEAEKAVEGADLAILCTPVSLFGGLLKQIGRVLGPAAVVTDVGSTKRSVVRLAEEHLPGPERFVGSHPIAGSEKRGVKFARADLFQDARCIITPGAATDPEALDKVETFWRTLGMRVVRMSPENHDRQLADISHLPHAVAAALVAIQADQSLAVCGKGFLDTTRIAAGDGSLWRDILLDNRDNVAGGIRRLREELDRLLVSLEKQDADTLRAWLDAAAARRLAAEQKSDR
jgi:prephenate dehydrogenase